MKLSAAEFLKHQLRHRASVRAQSEAANLKLLEVRDSTLTAIASLQRHVQGRRYKSVDGRMHLIAQYIQGIELSYTSIVEGLYAQAANLQKQQIETIAALEEYETGSRRDGKTPNVRQYRLPSGFGRQYGALNRAAHPSVEAVAQSIAHFQNGERQGPTTIPQFCQAHCQPLLANHCIYMLHLWRQMSNAFKSVFDIELDDDQYKLVNFSIRTLMDGGFISMKSQD